MKKDDNKHQRQHLRSLGDLDLYQRGNKFIFCLKNGPERSFNCIETAKQEMLYAFFKIIEGRNQKLIS